MEPYYRLQSTMDRPPHITDRPWSAIHRLRPTPRRRLDTVTDLIGCCIRCRGCQRPDALLHGFWMTARTTPGLNSIIANMFAFAPATLWEVEAPDVRKAVKVSFS